RLNGRAQGRTDGEVADDDRALRLLQASGENFRGRGATLVREDDDLAGKRLHAERRRSHQIIGEVAELNDAEVRLAGDQPSSHRNGHGAKAAWIAAQVEHDGLGTALAKAV